MNSQAALMVMVLLLANLYINNTTTDYVGLFGYVGTGGEVQNFRIT